MTRLCFFLLLCAQVALGALSLDTLTGLETGDLTEVPHATNCSVSSAQKNTGNYSLTVSNIGRADFTLTQTSTRAFSARFYGRFTSTNNTTSFFRIFDGSTELSVLRFQSGGTIRCDHGTVNATSTGTVSDATWTRIDVFWERESSGGAADGKCAVRINGTEEINFSNGDGSIVDQTEVRFVGASAIGDYWVDDLIVLTSSSSETKAYVSDGGIVALRPDIDDGTDDNFTDDTAPETNDASIWDETDDDPRDDTDYAEAPSSGSTPSLMDVTTQTGTPNYAVACIFASRSNGSGRSHFLRYRRATGTAQNSADLGLTSTVDYYCLVPTDQPSTQDHMDDLHVCGDQSAAGGRLMRVSEAYLMVDFQAAPPATKRRVITGVIAD